MNVEEHNRLKKLLQTALPPVDGNPEPAPDLWPMVLKRLHQKHEMPPWYDWALLLGLAAMLAVFPSAIPLVLYYL